MKKFLFIFCLVLVIFTADISRANRKIPLSEAGKFLLEPDDASEFYASAIIYWLDEKKRDYKKARGYLEQAAAQDYAPAQNVLGNFYKYGVGGAKDAEKAKELYEKAAKAGDSAALANLAAAYYAGDGCAQDKTKARELFAEAAKRGDARSLYNIGLMRLKGEGGAKDEEGAFRDLRASALQGVAEARYWMAYAYENGLGTPEDLERARRWYKQVGESGDAKGFLAAGDSYFYSKHEEFNESRTWYDRAARMGDALAQLQLGAMDTFGLGAYRRPDLAKYWFKRACQEGEKLGCQYYEELINDGY